MNVFATTATTLSDGSKKSSTEFKWTDDELELLLKYCANFKSQKEYQRINWEDTRNNFGKIKEIFINRYPTEEADIERFPNGKITEEIVTKGRISANVKIIRADVRKVVYSGKKSGGGRVVLYFIAYAKVYEEAAQQLIVFRILLIHRMILRRHMSQSLHSSHQRSLMK